MNTLQILGLRETEARNKLSKLFEDLKNDDGSWKAITAETRKEAEDLKTELEAIKSQKDLAAFADDNDKALVELKTVKDRVFTPPDDPETGDTSKPFKAFTVPATVRRTKSLKCFKEDRNGQTSESRAFAFGMWALANYTYNLKAIQYCMEHGIGFRTVDENNHIKTIELGRWKPHEMMLALKAQNEGTATAGGVLVPEEFLPDIIQLREVYGVMRRNAKVVAMTRDIAHVPRRTGGATAYWVNEGAAITESQKTWDYVDLTAKKLGALVVATSELVEDAIIDVFDDLGSEIAWLFSKAEDSAGFLGDGTAAFGGITGLVPKFTGLGTVANTAGIVIAPAQTTGNGWAAITMDTWGAVIGRLPYYAYQGNNVKWYVSQSFWGSAMVSLAAKSGGVALAEIIPGGMPYRFLGFPVEIVQVLPAAFAVSQIVGFFGDMSQAVMMGDRRTLTLRTSEHLHFAEDMLTLRGTERIDINVHDIGNNNASASLRVPGPLVAIMTAAT